MHLDAAGDSNFPSQCDLGCYRCCCAHVLHGRNQGAGRVCSLLPFPVPVSSPKSHRASPWRSKNHRARPPVRPSVSSRSTRDGWGCHIIGSSGLTKSESLGATALLHLGFFEVCLLPFLGENARENSDFFTRSQNPSHTHPPATR